MKHYGSHGGAECGAHGDGKLDEKLLTKDPFQVTCRSCLGYLPIVVEPDGREWVIWNADYHQFWGPDSGGYFGLWGAGLYTEADAKRLASNKDRRDQAHHITEYKDQIENMRGAFERLSLAIRLAARRAA